jgi:hypothetical protein
LKEELKPYAFKRKVLRKIFGNKKHEVSENEEYYKLWRRTS